MKNIIIFIILISIILYIRFIIKKKRGVNKINNLFYNSYYFSQFDQLKLNWRLISQESMILTKTIVKNNFFNLIINSNMLLQHFHICPITMKFLINIPNIIYAGFIFIDPFSNLILKSDKEKFNYFLGLNISNTDTNMYLVSEKLKYILNNGSNLVHNSNYNIQIRNNTKYDSVLLLIKINRC